MAQTGYSKVQIYSSSTATNTPSAGNLTNNTNGSELAINITDGKLFYKDNSGTVQVLATKSTALSTVTNNGVVYVNSSGQATSGSALVFDGTNLGLGVTPSAWTSSKAIQIGSSGAPYMGLAQMTTGTADGYMLWGAYLTGNRTFAYSTTGDPVSAYRQSANTHAWFNAPSGTAGNAITFTQAMTLDASGNLLVGTTSTSTTSGGLIVLPAAGQTYTVAGHITGTSSGAYYYGCTYNGSVVGGITQVGTTGVVLTSISDYRLKESIIPMQGSLAKVLSLNPVEYKWKSDGSDGEGFIAHELQAVIPTAATGKQDEVDEDGNAKYQGINLSAIVPHLVKSIQELAAQVTTLQTQVTALKG